MEVFSPSGRCNRKLQPLPHPARNPLVELVDGSLIACGGSSDDQKTCRLDAFVGSIFMGVTAGSRLKTCNTGEDTPALQVLEETCLSLEDIFLRKEG